MATTNFGSAIKTGSGLGQGSDAGFAVLSQNQEVNFVTQAGGGNDNVDFYFDLPAGSQIQNIVVDTLTAWNSVTSAGMVFGTSAGGTQYMSSVDVKSNGREAPTFTAAQLTAMADISTNTRVYGRVAQSGNTSAGKALVTVVYVQKN